MPGTIKLIVIAITLNFLLLLGQVSWKFTMEKAGLLGNAHSIWQYIYSVISTGYFFVGIVAYIAGTTLFLWLLSEYPLGTVIALSSLVYIFALFAGKLFFAEAITFIKLIGVIFIMVGVSFVAS